MLIITVKYMCNRVYSIHKDTMLKTNDIQINKIKLDATKISVALEDPEVNPEQYTFLKNRLDSYKTIYKQ